MQRPDNPPPARTPRPGRLTAEFQFLLIALALLMMIALAGVPGGPDKSAGDGSDALKLGWAERHAAAHAPIGQADPTTLGPDAAHR